MNPLPTLRKMTEEDRIAELKKLREALEKPASARPEKPRTKAAKAAQ